MISAIWKVAGPWFGRNGVLAASIAAIIALAISWDKSRVESGRQIERAAGIERGIELNAKGLAAHNRAELPGAVERVRAKYCTDC
jgi:hypothetical protein